MMSTTCYKVKSCLVPHAFLLLLWCMLIASSGCSKFNGTRAENLLGKETDLVEFSYQATEDLITKAFPPLVQQNPEMPILTTTFVDNNDLTKTSQFGRILQEHMTSHFTQMGYSVNEIKLAKTLEIQERSGETILSRDLKKISGNQKAQAILVGTISFANRSMYISTRLINPTTGTIISSADYKLPMDYHIMAMFKQKAEREPEAIQPPARPFLNSVL